MTQRAIVIAGTGSGVGKTTLTIGIMAALQMKGYTVQGFKCGPDYIDPTYHKAVTGRPSRNLDSWMCGEQAVKEIFARGAAGADISIIEGVMGLFDGRDPLSDEGSTAHISRMLDAPVLLTVNVQSMARSAAAVVRGFQLLSPAIRIVGVIANNAGSEGHCRMIKEAIEQECGIPVIGCLQRDDSLRIPDRHLGLVPSVERGELRGFYQELAEKVAAGVDLEAMLRLAEYRPQPVVPKLFTSRSPDAKGCIAVAKDAAFHFYYEENLELLELAGARLAYFSPLADEPVPADADGLYIGGGFPEEFAERLSGNTVTLESIRRCIRDGMPALAECGGYMYLMEEIIDSAGQGWPMAGLIPGRAVMQTRRAALGYRELTGPNMLLPAGETVRGHEFHYSRYEPNHQLSAPPSAWQSAGRTGLKPDGVQIGRLLAGYAHLHFASNPGVPERWVSLCREWR